jgi:hypothetical protein
MDRRPRETVLVAHLASRRSGKEDGFSPGMSPVVDSIRFDDANLMESVEQAKFSVFNGQAMKRKQYLRGASVVAGVELLFAMAYFSFVGFGDLMAAAETDSSKPYARVCISVLDENAASEVAFTPELKPGPGKSILAHAVANTACALLVAAFNEGDGQLAHDWRPQFKELDEEWEEVTIPEKKGAWRWEVKAEPFDFYVLFLSAGSPFADQTKDLVAAMQDPKEAKSILKLQTNKLHELISRAAGDSDPSKHRASATVTEIHGVTRGQNEFLWRSFASKVPFDDRNSGLLIFPNGT